MIYLLAAPYIALTLIALFQIGYKFRLRVSFYKRVEYCNLLPFTVPVNAGLFVGCKADACGKSYMLRFVKRTDAVLLRASSASANKSVKFEVGKISAVGGGLTFFIGLKLRVIDEFALVVVFGFLSV